MQLTEIPLEILQTIILQQPEEVRLTTILQQPEAHQDLIKVAHLDLLLPITVHEAEVRQEEIKHL